MRMCPTLATAAVAALVAAACGDDNAPAPPSSTIACSLVRGPGTRDAICTDHGARLEVPGIVVLWTIDVAVELDALPAEELNVVSGLASMSIDPRGAVACRAGSHRAVSGADAIAPGAEHIVSCRRDPGGVRVLVGDLDVTTTVEVAATPHEDSRHVTLADAPGLRGVALHARTTAGDASFTLGILPDTQYYTAHRYDATHDVLEAQTAWLAANRDRLSIPFVLHEGDCVETDAPVEWERFVDAMARLDRAGIPYAITTGNHDLVANAETRATKISRFFPPEAAAARGLGGVWRRGEIENAWYSFRAGGDDWLVLALEFGPREGALRWAEGVVRAHPEHRVILLTHAYVHSDDTLQGPGDPWNPHSYTLEYFGGEVNDGEEMWEKLVRRHAGMALVFSGHVLDDGTGLVIGTGDRGNRVVQMLANYQVRGNGGDGFLRIAQVNPVVDVLTVRTYSPWTDEWLMEKDHAFEVSLSAR